MAMLQGNGLLIMALFALTLYALGAVGFVLVRSAQGHTSPFPITVRPTVSGVLATTLAGLAMLSEIVLTVARKMPEAQFVMLLLVLLPVVGLCAVIGVLLGSLGLRSGLRLWNFMGLGLGTLALTAISLWLLSPVIFPPQ